MNRFVRTLLVLPAAAMMLLTAGAVSAQEDAGEPKGGGQVKTTTETIGKWTVTCSQGEKGNRCVVQQRLAMKGKKQVVASATVRLTKEGSAEIAFTSPTGVILEPGLTVNVDGEDAGKAVFRSCGPRACQSAVALDQELINRLAKGKELGITMQTVLNKPLALKFPLDGFTKAYVAFKKGVSE